MDVTITIHVIICLVLIGLVLLQQGKGANAGAVFGGGGDTMFGASGAGGILTKVTTAMAILFFCTTLFIAFENKNRSALEGTELLSDLPTSAELVESAAVVEDDSTAVAVEEDATAVLEDDSTAAAVEEEATAAVVGESAEAVDEETSVVVEAVTEEVEASAVE